MMHIKRENRIRFEHSEDCFGYEYPLENQKISAAVIVLKGRYPLSGYALNEEVQEMLYIVSGQGRIIIDESEYLLAPGDTLLIPSTKKYFMKGNLEMMVSCAPAWHPEQHKYIEETEVLSR